MQNNGSRKGLVLSLCDKTAVMVVPWAEAGFECICVDWRHKDGTRHPKLPITFVSADVRNWLPPKVEYKIVFAFPPSTDLVADRWSKRNGLSALADVLLTIDACRRICEWTDAPWMVENTGSLLSSYWSEPDVTFHPCDFGGYLEPPGDRYTRFTRLWHGGGFVMPHMKRVAPADGRMRSRSAPDDIEATPAGFARAVFEANVNAKHVQQEELFL
jgi:hypothetical protein